MANGDGSMAAYSNAALGENVQAHIGRASRFADGQTRDWSLFVFFRILSQQEFAANMKRLAAIELATSKREIENEYIRAVTHAGRANAGLAQPRTDETDWHDVAPAQPFRDWLKVLTDRSAKEIGDTLDKELHDAVKAKLGDATGANADDHKAAIKANGKTVFDNTTFPMLEKAIARRPGDTMDCLTDADRASMIWTLYHALTNPAMFRSLLDWFETDAPEGASGLETAEKAGRKALKGGLLTTFLYEILRQLAPAYGGGKQGSSVRSESRAVVEKTTTFDPVPVNYAFTFSGLKALNICRNTLKSFPEPFKEGMAARATRLGDSGPSAPEHWDNVLGLPNVHGYFTGGFVREQQGEREAWRRALRNDIFAFNDHTDEGSDLRALLGEIMALLGLEIVHIEMGEDPYDIDVDKDDKGTIAKDDRGVALEYTRRYPYRIEHFGFRDGISQPFVEMGVGDTLPGGGTPGRNRTWAPVAPGEIFLSAEDEDGNSHAVPAHKGLREGSTFIVFRKLEQDVARFRSFLEAQRPGQPKAQEKLAAQFMGRWKNGTSLVAAPEAPLNLAADRDGKLNDFLYAADDPHGLKCPLASHVRRSNPRDIGGTNEVRRHRILRRSIAYGGPVLPAESLGDDEKRGLLFICANARIDLQFEVIQADWINRGEILGQAGLNRCPITGTNNGTVGDAFLESGAAAPVTHLPRFVITRGGDYFFAPGVKVLGKIADGNRFELEEELPFGGRSFGDASTPILFEQHRLEGYAGRILARDRQESVIRVAVSGGKAVAFVARHEHVDHVLGSDAAPDPAVSPVYSMEHYRRTIGLISGGPVPLLAATERGPTAKTRERMFAIFNAAWALTQSKSPYKILSDTTRTHLDAALRRTGPSRRVDIVHDLGAVTAYNVMGKLFGTPGPKYLTELAVALPFSQTRVTGLEPDWLAAVRGGEPDDPGLVSWQVWSILLSLALGGNLADRADVKALGMQAGREFLTHLDIQIAEARAKRATTGNYDGTQNLLAAFVAGEKDFVRQDASEAEQKKLLASAEEYYGLVRMLLLEATSSVLFIPTTLGAIVDTLFHYGIDLGELLQEFHRQSMRDVLGSRHSDEEDHGSNYKKMTEADLQSCQGKINGRIEHLIRETCRLRPSIPMLTRICMQDDRMPGTGDLPSGSHEVKKGDYVVALLGAAGRDGNVFEDPHRLALGFPGDPKRDPAKYLLFGAKSKQCWGKEKLALYVLRECLKTAGRFRGLRPVAGPNGRLKKFLGANVGLSARFAGVR
jgi:Dyp-type peroxidase family